MKELWKFETLSPFWFHCRQRCIAAAAAAAAAPAAAADIGTPTE